MATLPAVEGVEQLLHLSCSGLGRSKRRAGRARWCAARAAALRGVRVLPPRAPSGHPHPCSGCVLRGLGWGAPCMPTHPTAHCEAKRQGTGSPPQQFSPAGGGGGWGTARRARWSLLAGAPTTVLRACACRVGVLYGVLAKKIRRKLPRQNAVSALRVGCPRNCPRKIQTRNENTLLRSHQVVTPWLTQCVTCRTEAATTRACESAKIGASKSPCPPAALLPPLSRRARLRRLGSQQVLVAHPHGRAGDDAGRTRGEQAARLVRLVRMSWVRG